MEKQFAKWTYWVGVACAAIALIMRGLNAVGLYLDLPGVNLGHMSFYKASFLLLAIAIATSTTMRAQRKE